MSAFTEPDVPRTAAFSSTARGPAGNRSSVDAISARSDPGSAVLSGCDADHRRQLGEEQRISPAAFVEPVDEGRAVPVAEHRIDELVGLVARQRVERHAHRDGVVGGGRPVDVDVVAMGGDHQHAPVDERPGDPTEQVDHEPVGPLQVVEPHDDRAVLRAAAEAFDHHGEQRFAGPRRGHRIERRTGWPSRCSTVSTNRSSTGSSASKR